MVTLVWKKQLLNVLQLLSQQPLQIPINQGNQVNQTNQDNPVSQINLVSQDNPIRFQIVESVNQVFPASQVLEVV